MDEHFRRNGASLDDTAVRSQVAVQDGDAAGLREGVVHVADDFVVGLEDTFEVLLQGLAGAGHDVGVDETGLRQLLQDGMDAAGLIEVLHVSGTGRSQMADIRRVLGDLVDLAKVHLHVDLVRDGGQVQDRVGRAAEGHVGGDGIPDGIFGQDVSGPDVLPDEFHDLHTGFLRELDAGGVRRRDGAVAGEAHAHDFRQAVHGVRGVHAGAGTAGRADLFFVFPQLGFRNLAGRVRADRFEHAGKTGLVAVNAAGQHGAAGDENGGKVQTGRGHQEAGNVLVAVRDHDEAVKAVGFDHGFGGVRDEVSRNERILHAFVAHGDAVADGDGREHDRGAAAHGDADADRFRDLVEVHVTGDDLVVGADDADEGTSQFFLGETQGIVQGAMGRVLEPIDDGIFDHGDTLLPKLTERAQCLSVCALSFQNDQLLMSLSSSDQLYRARTSLPTTST